MKTNITSENTVASCLGGVCGFTLEQCAGCGAGLSTRHTTMRLSVTSTTGTPVEVTVPRGETVEGLRTCISQKLRLQTNRIVLLHNDRQLTTGKLLDFGVVDGSKITLVPVIEAGLVCSTNRPERTLIDVLQSLTEVQISDFLSGHSPLTINLRIGAHMMYVQLQLSSQDAKELQQDGDVKVNSSVKHETGLLPPGHPDSASAWSSTNSTGSTTSPASLTSPSVLNTADSTSPIQPSIKRRRMTFNSKDPASHLSTFVPVVTSSLPSGCPYPSCPVRKATPVCSPAPSGSSPEPPSSTAPSAFKKSHIIASSSSSTAELCKQSGAVIDNLVSHSAGIFSGTFSGRLAPCSQSSMSHPRPGIAIILQILNDLLRAANNHQGALPTFPQCHSTALNRPVSPVLTAEDTSKPLVTQRAEHCNKPPVEGSPSLHFSTEENKTLHCKLERLQYLMHQRRVRRRTRRSSCLSHTSHPYQHYRHRS